ncbi:adenylyl-sulfate kinase [Candidatus Thioglobus sp.]|uniref:adenylyl-sulfate kinase n=1 Tax=Candidatus Thioglobus sp. TaxID=2026721 RepID=UPI003D0E7D36
MKTPNTIYHNATVTREKHNQLNSHKSTVIWLTGLSGSGKSTLAHSVEEKLHKLGCQTFVLDGDNVRHGLSSNLSFSDNDRRENIRRIGEVASLMMEAGVIVMTAFISPFREDRNNVRKLLPQGDFIEIYCKSSLEVCESRDVKGLYKLARAGEIKNYTGIDSPYEEPNNPELVINTESESLEESVGKVIDLLKAKGIIE